METGPQHTSARSQWLEVMGGAGAGRSPAVGVKGAFLGTFIGLKQMGSPDRGVWQSLSQVCLCTCICCICDLLLVTACLEPAAPDRYIAPIGALWMLMSWVACRWLLWGCHSQRWWQLWLWCCGD